MNEYDLISDSSAAMTAVGETTALVVESGYIFATFTDVNQNAVLAKKGVNGTAWETSILGTGVLNDAHNSSSIGIDPQGYIHACWDIHSKPVINYKQSQSPLSIQDMMPATMGGVQPYDVSYARFYRAGSEFYFLCRVGYSGNGNEWIKRWTPAGWIDLAIPLIDGMSLSPTDNPYMGSCFGTPDGCLHITWTHRVGLYNYGVYYAKYSPATNMWTRADGGTYTLPITRLSAGQSLTDTLDGTISNNGLGVVVNAVGHLHIVFSKHVNGSPGVFHTTHYINDQWTITQLSNLHLPRLRACPTGPQDGPPRPCDYELQGPFISITDNSLLRVLYLRSVGKAGTSWQRPPGILYEAVSTDGINWTTREIRRDVNSLLGEPIRESSGKAVFLLQEVTGSSNLWLWTPETTDVYSPVADVSVSLPCAETSCIELDSSLKWSSIAWTISSWMVPRDTKATMGIIDKGGAVGQREFRLLLWGNAPPFVYDPKRVQVLIGGVSAWGFMWHPEVEVLPGMITHLGLTWNGSQLVMYKNGVVAAQVTTSGVSIIHSDLSKVLIGANRASTGGPERAFYGDLRVTFYPTAISATGIKRVYEVGLHG